MYLLILILSRLQEMEDSDSDAPALQTVSLEQLETPKRKLSVNAWGGSGQSEEQVFNPVFNPVFTPPPGNNAQNIFYD
jgi:hypothetical protein